MGTDKQNNLIKKLCWYYNIGACIFCIILMTLMCITAIEKYVHDRNAIVYASGKLIKTWEIMFMSYSFWLECNITLCFFCNFHFLTSEYEKRDTLEFIINQFHPVKTKSKF